MITSRAEMPPRPHTQHQRAAELDDRLSGGLGGGGAGAVVVATTTAEYNRDRSQQPPQPQNHLQHSPAGQQQQQQQQIPLLVDIDQQYRAHQQVDHLLISPHQPNHYQHQHHDQYTTSDMQQPLQVAFYPHNLQQQQQQHHVGYLLAEPPDTAPLTSLLDLDEGTHNQQEQEQQRRYSHNSQDEQQLRVTKQETSGRLPESVIRVNDWSERKLSSAHQFYGDSSGSGCRQYSRAAGNAPGESPCELTTLNSAAAASFDRSQQPHLVHHHHSASAHQQHRCNDSTSSFNLSTNSTISMLGAGGGGGVSSSLAYGRVELDGYSSTSALVGPSSQLLPSTEHDLYGDGDEDEDQDEARPQRSYGPERTKPRTSTTRTRASSHHHRRRGRQAASTPAGSDDGYKVCEWQDCGNSFLDMKDFVRHLEERHVGMEPAEKNRYFCMWTDCKRNNQEFNARYKLLIHMRVHSGEKPFTCDQSPYCKKSFSRLENLKIHKRSHTGEKPYRCNYEHCSKSFTNSSDRIKHHKTHKDPKPYTCAHEGCTKRYTDPSSLRKHLRAHKRHGDVPDMIGQPHPYSTSSSSAAHLYHSSGHNHDTSNHLQHQHHQELSFSSSYQTAREHITPPQQQQPTESRLPVHNYAQQQQQQQQQQYSFSQQQQQQYGTESYTTIDMHGKQMYDQQPYLHADYDPAKEFESVLSDVPTITQQDEQLSSSFKQPRQQQQQQPLQFQHRTDSTVFVQSSQPEHQQQQTKFSAILPSQQHIFSPTVSARYPSQQRFSEAQARQHERLSRSWSVGNSTRSAPTARRQHCAPESATRLLIAGSGFESSSSSLSSQRQIQNYHIKQTPEFGLQTQAQPHSQEWSAAPTGWSQQNHTQQQGLTGQNAPFTSYNAYQMTQQQHAPSEANQQTLEQWPPSSHYGEQSAVASGQLAMTRTGHRVQFQEQFQQRQQQQQQQPSRQLTRQQQHEQLMRSMPANVNL